MRKTELRAGARGVRSSHKGAFSADYWACRSAYDGSTDDPRGPTFIDCLTDLLAFGIVGLFLLVVTHSLGWWA